MSETTHSMMLQYVLEKHNTKPHNMHKCINIFQAISKSNKYTHFMTTIINSWELWTFGLLCSQYW